MSRRVVVSGIGPVSGLGLGRRAHAEALRAGRSAIGPITRFESEGFACQLGAEVPPFKIRDHVPKSYRKATKVMARDIELAVVAADLAARDAGLVTPGTDAQGGRGDGFRPSYPAERFGAHVGAGLIAADLDELTLALTEAVDDHGDFDIHRWGREGMGHLTPLWLLKYLPNMLACHLTIVHDAQGPSNTITCAETSGALCVGESLRVIQRDDADCCFCGGAESKLNPMAFLRQEFAGRLAPLAAAAAEAAGRPPVRSFSRCAAGTVIGEGGGILVLEALESCLERGGATPLAELVGFGASHTHHPEDFNRSPDPEGRAITSAARRALEEAGVGPEAVDLIIPGGFGEPAWDAAEVAGLRRLFGERLAEVPIVSNKPQVGNCVAGASAIDLCVAAEAIAEQRVPATGARPEPLEGLAPPRESHERPLRHVLAVTPGFGGQNAAILLKRYEEGSP